MVNVRKTNCIVPLKRLNCRVGGGATKQPRSGVSYFLISPWGTPQIKEKSLRGGPKS